MIQIKFTTLLKLQHPAVIALLQVFQLSAFPNICAILDKALRHSLRISLAQSILLILMYKYNLYNLKYGKFLCKFV